jgi:hypothetical protein
MEGHVTVDAVEERCVLVGVITSEVTEEVAQEHLDELEFLAETAGAITVEKFFQKLPYPNPRTYVGTGKLEEIKQYMKALDIELIIFDDELSPSQLRNIERELECKVLDRTILQAEPERFMPKRKLNWHSYNTCCRVLPVCGPTLNDKKEVLVYAAQVNLKLKRTDGLFSNVLPS